MNLPVTLILYVGRRFLGVVLWTLAALSGLVSLFDFLELLRRSALRPHVTFGLIAGIALLRLPWLMMQILPFAVLVGGILAFWRMTKHSELIVARAGGISAWQFLSVPVLYALLIGVTATAAVTPLSAATMARADALESAYINVGSGPLTLSGGHLWLRQADRGFIAHGVAILHAHAVRLVGKKLIARGVSVFRLTPNDRLLSRIEAPRAVLERGVWQLEGAQILKPSQLPGPTQDIRLPTDLTVARVEESFASPDTLSFWQLPGFIALLERSGFSAIAHSLRFQSLLALPLLCGTMALVAAGFSMRPPRRGRVGRMLAAGLGAGFALFMLSQVADRFGQSGALPVVLAAWAPAAAGLMLAVALLLHLEDG